MIANVMQDIVLFSFEANFLLCARWISIDQMKVNSVLNMLLYGTLMWQCYGPFRLNTYSKYTIHYLNSHLLLQISKMTK